MDAAEKIVEAFMRSVMHCLTSANIKCRANKEIDLLAVDKRGRRYHVESTVKTSHFGVLKNKPMKEATGKADKRRTMEFFIEQKFDHPRVVEALREWGFRENRYQKVIVVMRSEKDAEEEAQRWGIEIWHFPELVTQLFDAVDRPEYLSGEERVFQLIAHSLRQREKEEDATG